MLVAACSGQATTDESQTQVESGEPTVPSAPAERRKVSKDELASAVGRDCKTPLNSEFKGSQGDQDFYVLKCSNEDFMVSIKVDGSTNVLECGFAEKMGVSCKNPW
jgi:hypothetical protein